MVILPKMNEPRPERMSSLRLSLILVSIIGATAVAVYLATFRHAPARARPFYALAAMWTATATVAPIWLESLIFNGATFQLAVVTWRLMTMLGAFVIAGALPSEVRNYFLSTLMACYFVALPLESWLLARRASQ